MVSSTFNSPDSRKSRTIDMHKVLLRIDERDISGQVIIHYKKGEGIVSYEVNEKHHFNGIKK